MDDAPRSDETRLIPPRLSVRDDRARVVGHDPGIGSEVEVGPAPHLAEEGFVKRRLDAIRQLVVDEDARDRVDVVSRRRPKAVSAGKIHTERVRAHPTGIADSRVGRAFSRSGRRGPTREAQHVRAQTGPVHRGQARKARGRADDSPADATSLSRPSVAVAAGTGTYWQRSAPCRATPKPATPTPPPIRDPKQARRGVVTCSKLRDRQRTRGRVLRELRELPGVDWAGSGRRHGRAGRAESLPPPSLPSSTDLPSRQLRLPPRRAPPPLLLPRPLLLPL